MIKFLNVKCGSGDVEFQKKKKKSATPGDCSTDLVTNGFKKGRLTFFHKEVVLVMDMDVDSSVVNELTPKHSHIGESLKHRLM